MLTIIAKPIISVISLIEAVCDIGYEHTITPATRTPIYTRVKSIAGVLLLLTQRRYNASFRPPNSYYQKRAK